MNMHRTIWREARPAEILARAKSIAPLVSAEATAAEELGSLTPAVAAALREQELFWVLVPEEYGGLQCDLPTTIEVFEEVSRADGSAGWTLMASGAATGVASGFCAKDAAAAMFGGARRAVVAGMVGPGGSCREVPEGFRGSGKYRFGSGVHHADWIAVGMFIVDDNVMRRLPNGEPQVLIGYVPRKDVDFVENWDVFGLSGTGSIDYEVKDALIPTGLSFERTVVRGQSDWRLFDIGVQGIVCAGHAAVALGIVKRAIEEIAQIASMRTRPNYKGLLGEQAVFRHDFAYHEADYQAMRAYTLELYREIQGVLDSGGDITPLHRQRMKQNVIHVHKVGARIVQFCYTMGGSDSLRNPSPLGRCMRDMSAATQHLVVDSLSMVDAVVPILEHWRSARA